MSDSNHDGLDPVDQGTAFMLSVSFGLLAVALIYFTCKWYRKRKSKQTLKEGHTKTEIKSESKSNVQRSFSRFSHVDDECTYIDDHGLDPVNVLTARPFSHSSSPRSANKIKRATTSVHTSSRITSSSSHNPATREHRKSAPPGHRVYLETSI